MPNPNTFSPLYANVAEESERTKNTTQENSALSESLANKNENEVIHNISNRFHAIKGLTPVEECVKENGVTEQDIEKIQAKSLYLETKEVRSNGKSGNPEEKLSDAIGREIASYPMREIYDIEPFLNKVAKQSAFESIGFDLNKAKQADGIIGQCLNRGDIKPVLDDLREDMPLDIDKLTPKP